MLGYFLCKILGGGQKRKENGSMLYYISRYNDISCNSNDRIKKISLAGRKRKRKEYIISNI